MDKVTTVTNLKATLSAHLARVKQGEEFLVTDHGRPVAKLVPFVERTEPDLGLETLIRDGVLSAPSCSESAADFLANYHPVTTQTSVLEALLEERADGR